MLDAPCLVLIGDLHPVHAQLPDLLLAPAHQLCFQFLAEAVQDVALQAGGRLSISPRCCSRSAGSGGRGCKIGCPGEGCPLWLCQNNCWPLVAACARPNDKGGAGSHPARTRPAPARGWGARWQRGARCCHWTAPLPGPAAGEGSGQRGAALSGVRWGEDTDEGAALQSRVCSSRHEHARSPPPSLAPCQLDLQPTATPAPGPP